MKNYKLGVVAVLLALLLSACTGTGGKSAWYDQWGACAAGGAAAGIAAGSTDDFDRIDRAVDKILTLHDGLHGRDDLVLDRGELGFEVQQWYVHINCLSFVSYQLSAFSGQRQVIRVEVFL